MGVWARKVENFSNSIVFSMKDFHNNIGQKATKLSGIEFYLHDSRQLIELLAESSTWNNGEKSRRKHSLT